MKIGAKLKRLRMAKNLTQEELASRTDLSKGFISQVESDTASPSILTLADILEALGVNLADFFQDSNNEKVIFTKDSRLVTNDSNEQIKIELLIPGVGKRKMDPALVSLISNSESFKDNTHAGEEFGYILQGQVTLELDMQTYSLKKGDCFYFPSDRKHQVRNIGSQTAQILWIVTPPIF